MYEGYHFALARLEHPTSRCYIEVKKKKLAFFSPLQFFFNCLKTK